MAEMTKERRQEIAMAYCEMVVVEKGIPPNLKQELGNVAKRLEALGHKITTDDVLEFYRGFLPRALGRAFGVTRVDLHMSDE